MGLVQLNPIHGVLLGEYNPILVSILDQINPIHGVIIGFKEPNIGLGRTFPIWENPLKSQMIPINFPLLTQFGNFEKFPVCKTVNKVSCKLFKPRSYGRTTLARENLVW